MLMIGMLGLCSEAHAKLIVALQPVAAGSPLNDCAEFWDSGYAGVL